MMESVPVGHKGYLKEKFEYEGIRYWCCHYKENGVKCLRTVKEPIELPPPFYDSEEYYVLKKETPLS